MQWTRIFRKKRKSRHSLMPEEKYIVKRLVQVHQVRKSTICHIYDISQSYLYNILREQNERYRKKN